MKCLAIECSMDATSVALTLGAGTRSVVHDDYVEHAFGAHDGRSEALMPMLAKLAERSGGFAGVNRIAVTTGPGSFTGVRVGMAAARGLALSLRVPVVGISSLVVMAHRADHLLQSDRLGVIRAGAILVATADARRGQIYLQVFGEDVSQPLCEPQVSDLPAATLLLRGLAAGRRVIAVGSGAALMSGHGLDGLRLEPCLPRLQPHARYLVALAPAMLAADAEEPLYLRSPDVRPQTHQALPRLSAFDR